MTTDWTTRTQTQQPGSLSGDAPAAVIEIDALRHQYGDRLALNGVSFGVNRAEIFGLLGPNGSGKTTLFRILTTLMLPTAGRALVLGHDVARDPSGVRRQIGVVFQSRSIDVKLSAEENLIHVGHLYGITGPALKKRVAEMLERVSLGDRAKELAETFSGGMQRRLELAKGLLHHPQVLLLDEPSTGLDPGARRDLWQYLQLLRDQEGVSVLLTTHLMEEAEKCDRLAILSHGNLVGLGTPAQLKSEIGGDVILLDARDSNAAEKLAGAINARFAAGAVVLDDSRVRMEREAGHRFVTDLVEAFPGEIEAVSVSKPTLEDVFIRRTGHRFWNEDAEALEQAAAASTAKKKKKH